jgi:phage tail sheath protein FI
LGLSKGGREKEGASSRRPASNGTTSADLADLVGTNISGDLTIVVNDNSTSPSVPIPTVGTPTFTLTNIALGSTLADKLQEELRKLDNPATKNATAKFVGTMLQVVPSASTPNASIVLTGTGADAARLGATSFPNIQQYSLGVGPNFGAQTGAKSGANGTPPEAGDLIGSYNDKTGMYALRDVDLFNLLVIPLTSQLDANGSKSVMAAAIAFCKEERAFYLVDPDPSKTWDNMGEWVSGLGISERNAAIFFPHVQVADPLDSFRLRSLPPSGTVAGVFARTDASRGIWKAPAGIDATLTGVQGLTQTLTDQENGALNPLGINCLRSFPGYGRVVWGARTLRGGDQFADEYKYIPVRRLALYIEESLFRGLKWVVFEGNDEPLWSQIRLNAGAFMHNLFRQGAFQGTTPRDAYFVKCDKETTTQNDINLGIVNIVVGFAPLKPAEFVILKLQQMAGQIQV